VSLVSREVATIAWLDDQCLAGRVAWTRLQPRDGRQHGGTLRSAASAQRADHVASSPRRRAAGLSVGTAGGLRPEPAGEGGVGRFTARKW